MIGNVNLLHDDSALFPTLNVAGSASVVINKAINTVLPSKPEHSGAKGYAAALYIIIYCLL